MNLGGKERLAPAPVTLRRERIFSPEELVAGRFDEIVIIDDNEDAIFFAKHIITSTLMKRGYTIPKITPFSGRSPIRLSESYIKGLAYEGVKMLVITDINLPLKSGSVLGEELKVIGQRSKNHIQVGYMSSDRKGVPWDDFISKPEMFQTMVTYLNRFYPDRQNEDEKTYASVPAQNHQS